MELICPAGNMPSLKTALQNGADAIYVGMNNTTNARNFSGLNFSESKLSSAINFTKQYNKKYRKHTSPARLFVAINTFPGADNITQWQSAIDYAATLGVDAVILADIGLMEYTNKRYPQLNIHVSVQASTTNIAAINFYHKNFNAKRAVLPRVLSLKQVQQLAEASPIDLEVFGFGSLCIMAEGRCHLSSYLTSESPNLNGVCSPAKCVTWEESNGNKTSKLNGFLIDRFAPHEIAGYPTLCKGRFVAEGKITHTIEEPTSLNTLSILPDLFKAGIKAIKIEGRQRSPAYVKQVTNIWRQALDAYQNTPSHYRLNSNWIKRLDQLSEGSQTTLGAYNRPWQ